MKAALIPVALASLTAAAPAADRDPLAGRVAGPPVECVDEGRIGGAEIIDDRTLLYRDGRRIWRNDLPAACPGLRPTATLIVERWGTQLCRNDLIRAHEPGSVIPGAPCRLGSFTPYDLVK